MTGAHVSTVTVTTGPLSLRIETPRGTLNIQVDFEVEAASNHDAKPAPKRASWALPDSNVVVLFTPTYKQS